MHEGAINLVGANAAILQNEDGAVCIEFPRRAEGRLKQREAATEEAAFGLALHKRISPQSHFPSAAGVADSLQKRVFVIAVRVIGATIQSGGGHGAVEGHPTTTLPEINLQRGEIAEADDAFGLLQLRAKIGIEQIRGTIAATKRDEASNLGVARRLQKRILAFSRRGRKVAFRARQLNRGKLKTQAAEFGDSRGDIQLIGG